MLTIVIPTRNRPGLLRRSLAYYAQTDCPHRIIVADSSHPHHQCFKHPAARQAMKRLRIEYDVLSPKICLEEKIKHSLAKVSTPYAVMGADDDFFVPSSLHAASKFLDTHPDYSAAHGITLKFGVAQDAVHGNITRLGTSTQRQLEQQHAHERFYDHLTNFSATWYSVQRTRDLIQNYKDTAAANIVSIEFGELFPSCLSAIRGKIKKLDCLYNVRQIDTIKSYTRRSPLEWIAQPIWHVEFQAFRECLSERLAYHDAIDIGRAKRTVDEAFWIYFARFVVRGAVTGDLRGDTKRRWLKTIAELIPRVFARLRGRKQVVGDRRQRSARRRLSRMLRANSRRRSEFLPIYNSINDGPVQTRRARAAVPA